MSFTATVENYVNEDDWDNSLTKSKHATAFQSAYFFKPNQVANKSKPIFIKIFNQDKVLVGQLSCLIDKKTKNSSSFSKLLSKQLGLGSILHWKHGPIIHDNNNYEEILTLVFSTLEKICKEEHVEILKGTSPPLDRNFTKSFFKENNYEVTPWKNYIINLPSSSDDFLTSLHNKIRYDIRKGIKNQLTFEVASTLEELDEFGFLKYGKRVDDPTKILEQGKDGIKSAWEYHFKKGIRKLFLVRYNGELIGGINALVMNNIVCHTTVVNSSKNMQGGSFLTWNSIKWAIENNNLFLDLGGANPNPKNKKEEGIDHYKSKWNGIEYSVFHFSKIFNKKRSKVSGFLKRL